MAVTETEKQVQWSAANSLSLATVTEGQSDVVNFPEGAFAAAAACHAAHSATAGAGDTVDFYLARTLGDPIGTGADKYPVDRTACEFLCTIDCDNNDDDTKVVDLPLPAHNAKIYAYNNAGESITIGVVIICKVA